MFHRAHANLFILRIFVKLSIGLALVPIFAFDLIGYNLYLISAFAVCCRLVMRLISIGDSQTIGEKKRSRRRSDRLGRGGETR